ncbi:zinc-ribbon domain-containing protein [Agreia sp. Leaf244]|uniref:zinc-ribbon domain-containing protein n=1 Tax=Agreia sp. Leaf244 TaxID=1736305 RepID=UPI001F45CE90|nr:zinc-ribbon domain-containing protein [Agreia sp. Leaf244]
MLAGFNDLASQNPALAAEWDPEGNGKRRPTTMMPGSSYRAQWLCGTCGHRWRAAISERKKGSGCPACSGRALQPGSNDLATRRPELAAEWDAARNAPLSPAQVTNGSGMKVWWLCAARGHSWCGPINTRTAGSCGICSGTHVIAGLNDLASQRPDLLEEWDYNANGADTPDRVFVNGSARRHWKCAKHDHRWITTVAMRNEGSGCPYCSSHRVLAGFNDFASARPSLVKEWDQAANGDLKPTQVTARSNKRIWWKCAAGHQWQSTPSNRFIGTGCTRCIGAQTSLIEMSFFAAFQEQLGDLRNGARVLVKKRGQLRSMSLDILGTSHGQRFAIEYDGEYYHRGKTDHDLAKTAALLDAGYAVVRIREKPLPAVALSHPHLRQIDFGYPRTQKDSGIKAMLAPVVEEATEWLEKLN